MFSKYFIERPVLANVIAFVMVLLGGVAMVNLPIAQYPPITPPTVSVTARYPGASAATVMKTVALPIEQQVNGVEDMLYMQSTSANDGSYNLIVTFAVGTDLDFAQVLVQNRVQAAMAQLPGPVQQQGVVTQKKSTAFLQIITLTSPNDEYDALFLSNYATLSLDDELTRLPGVGDVLVFGSGEYSMRIWLDPQQLQERSLIPSDIISSIQQQNAEVAAGQIGGPPARVGQDFQYTINLSGPLDQVEQFENIIVKASSDAGGQITRLRDVARVELGSQTYSQFFKFNGKPAAGIAIFQLPEANALDTATAVEKAMDKLSKRFPEGIEYTIPFDTTIFVKASVEEVYVTLVEAGILVLIVIVVFLQDWRATLVPATTVPVTIIGAFAAMAAMGFSINLLTLFAIVLAIGIVVDDAIVVVEGAAQHIGSNVSPKDAAILAMKDLFKPIIGITLVLMSVFIPASFVSGITGEMYRQFALVIASTALISAVNAITLKPTQCALWLRPLDPHRRKNFFFRGFDAVYGASERGYVRLVRRMLSRAGLAMFVGLLVIAAALWGLTKVPTGFIPTEDQGYAFVIVQLPDAASLQRTEAVMARVAEIAHRTPGVQDTLSIGGVSPLDNNASLANSGIVYVMLKPWEERGRSEGLREIYLSLDEALRKEIVEASCRVLVPPPIQGLGLSGGFQMQVQKIDSNLPDAVLQEYAEKLATAATAEPAIEMAFTNYRANVPQFDVIVNREQTETLNVAVGNVFSTVQTFLGSSFVNLFTKFGFTFTVFAQADKEFRGEMSDLDNLYVRSQSGGMVPVGSLATVVPSAGPAIVSLYDLYPSAGINGATAKGYSSGEVLATMERLAAEILPDGIDYQWTAMSYQEKLVGSSTYLVFGLAMVLVYFVLAGQYESWITPVSVILAVPMTLIGTVTALLAVGIENNIYVQIGLVLLISLSAKNAILIVEMAAERRAAGMPLLEAATEASRIRFRPILMTSFTFMLGVLPLVLSTGAGAAARISLGITVLTGMLASTCLAVVFVPSFYVILQRLAERRAAKPHEP